MAKSKTAKQLNEDLAMVFVEPVMNIVDLTLKMPVLLETAAKSLESMGANMSSAQAVSGLLLDMDDVDKRQVSYETFRAAVALLRARKKQQEIVVSIHEKKGKRLDFAKRMGF